MTTNHAMEELRSKAQRLMERNKDMSWDQAYAVAQNMRNTRPGMPTSWARRFVPEHPSTNDAARSNALALGNGAMLEALEQCQRQIEAKLKELGR